MSAVEASVAVRAPVAAVWEVLTDLDRLGEWLTVHDAFEDAPERLREGAEMEQQVSSGPVSAKVEWRLTTVETHRSLVWEGTATGGADVRTTWTLSAEGDGTRVECDADFTLPGGPLGAVARRIAQPTGNAEAQASLERLRDLVETGA